MLLSYCRSFLLYILLALFGFSSNALAGISIIRDSEIEEFFYRLSAPLLARAGVPDTRIYIIEDKSLNAFAYIDGNIYLHTGLIAKFSDVNVLRGIIAHEIGHISERHIVRQQENVDDMQKILFSALAIGIAGALSSNQDYSGDILGASYSLGAHLFERNLLHYSRSYEAAADHVAFKLLEGSGHSVSGLIDFFNFTKSAEGAVAAHKYDLTHPLSRERVKFARSFYENSQYKGNSRNSDAQKNYERVRAKLIAFTAEPAQLGEPLDLLGDQTATDEISNYVHAISNLRLNKLERAINYTDRLLGRYPNDAFYNELKGEILLYFGKKDAIKYYDIACNLRKDDLLMKLSRALAAMSLHKKPSKDLERFARDLKLILDLQRDDNVTALYYLASYHQRKADKGNYLLYSALFAAKSGKTKQAMAMARAALKILPKNTPSWYKTSDLIQSLHKQKLR